MSKHRRRITKEEEIRSPPIPVVEPIHTIVVWSGPVAEETEVSHWRVWSMGDTHRAIEAVGKFADKEIRYGASNGKGIILNPDCGSLRNAMSICEMHFANKNHLDTNLIASNKDAILAEYENEKFGKKDAPAIAPISAPVYDSGEKSIPVTESKRKAKMKVNLKVAVNLLTACGFAATMQKSKAGADSAPGSKGEAKILDLLTKFPANVSEGELDKMELSEAQRKLATKLLNMKKGEEIDFIRKDEDSLPPEPEKKATAKKDTPSKKDAKKSEPEEEEESEPEETKEPKKSGKGSKKGEKKVGVLAFIMSTMLKATAKKPISKDDLISKTQAQFPDRKPEGLKITATAACGTKWWESHKKAVEVHKSDKGFWMTKVE